jgi:hypothetical protein
MHDRQQISTYPKQRMKTTNRTILFIVTIMLTLLLSSCGLFLDTGPFVITVDPYHITAQSIAVSESAVLGFDTGTLSVNAPLSVTGLTYDALPIEDILESEGLGQNEDKTYVSYGFFLKNTGTATVFIDIVLRVTEVSEAMDDNVRFLVIQDNSTQRIFKKADDPEQETADRDDQPFSVTLFESGTVVYRDAITELKPSEVIAFKVVIWVDSDDPDFGDADIMADIKADMTFQIADTRDKGTLVPGDREMWFTVTNCCSVSFDISHEETSDT